MNSSFIGGGGGSSILMPQAANHVQSKQANVGGGNSLTIEWPEPGINVDQLEQLEARFSIQPDSNIKCSKSDTKQTAAKDNGQSTTTTMADDEWSDFVSVVQPQTPITNILNKNLLKQQNNEEDDWSEFVSSTPPSLSSLHQFAPPSQNFFSINTNTSNASAAAAATTTTNTNYNNVFTPWTTTPFPQKINAYHQNNSDVYGKSANSLRYTKTVNSISNGESSHQFQNAMSKPATAPSIISLPDLGFVAPKSLVNMPNRNLAKK